MASRVNDRREQLLSARDWSTPVIGLMMRGDWQAELIARSDELEELSFLREIVPFDYAPEIADRAVRGVPANVPCGTTHFGDIDFLNAFDD